MIGATPWAATHWLVFRATPGLIADGADQTVVPGKSGTGLQPWPYAVTIDGIAGNVGWNIATNVDGARDRNAAAPAQLAGIHRVANGTATRFTVDLPVGPGRYEIRLAVGDAYGAASTSPHIVIRDGATVLAVADGTAGITGFMDATGVNRSAGNWAAQNQPVTLSFTTPQIIIDAGGTATVGTTALAAIGMKYLGP